MSLAKVTTYKLQVRHVPLNHNRPGVSPSALESMGVMELPLCGRLGVEKLDYSMTRTRGSAQSGVM